jgi:phosphoribosylformylglycinamidine synthase I
VACSETQERYGLAVPARLTQRVLEIYNEDFALPTLYKGACARLIGKITAEKQFVLRHGERILCQAAVETITSGIRYERPFEAVPREEVPPDSRLPEADPAEIASEWLGLMAHPNIASREYVYRHYDTEVQANTILRPGEADAGVVAPLPGCRRAVALAADGNPLLGLADPYQAGARAVLEVCRNVACVGGVPAAVTDCLNFGNPEVPGVFWQFREAVRGIADACHKLGRLQAPDEPLPVISGNVSFYNQSNSGSSVAPSPIVACIGIIPDYRHSRSQHFKSPGDAVFLIGAPTPDLDGTIYRQAGFRAGRPAVPQLDFETARLEIAAMLELVHYGLITAAHDISDGGLAVCLAEMAVGLEGQYAMGVDLKMPMDLADLSMREFLFCEQGGFLVTASPADVAAVEQVLAEAKLDWWRLGEVTTEETVTIKGADSQQQVRVELLQLAQAWQQGLPRLLGGTGAADVVPKPPVVRVSEATREKPSAKVPHHSFSRGTRPRIAVLQLPGVNCEDESARALRDAGGDAEIFRWTRTAASLAQFDGFLIPGGFSYQDRVRAGAIAAKDPLLDVLHAAAAAGKPILGICNGCQVLVESGLVPGINPGAVEVALAANRYPGRHGYHSRWTFLKPVPGARTGFCMDLPESLPIPVAHAEGRFTHEDPEFFSRLAREGYIALQYTDMAGQQDGNPNGSMLATAALSNQRGNVLAMMPHPERAAWLYQVPEDLPHSWGEVRRAAAGEGRVLQSPGPGFVLLQRMIGMC